MFFYMSIQIKRKNESRYHTNNCGKVKITIIDKPQNR